MAEARNFATTKQESAASTLPQAAPKPDAPQPLQRKTNSKDSLAYIYIPPGTFAMGCSQKEEACLPNEKPPHTLTKGFWKGETEVTQEAYAKVMGLPPVVVDEDEPEEWTSDWA